MLFNFPVNQALFYALATADTGLLARAIRDTSRLPGSGQWAHFLRNHDELDLARLTPPQRGRVYEAFAPEPEMQLYRRGVRRRLAPMLDSDRRRLELAYSLLFTLPGTPVLRYGDEIGMGEDLALPERMSTRTPMQWSSEPQGGFTATLKPVIPVIDRGAYGYRHVNVAAQRRNPNSLLNWMERVLRMRAEIPEIGWGRCAVLDSGSPGVLMLRYDWRNNAVLFLHNFTAEPVELRFRLGPPRRRDVQLVNLLSEKHSRAGRDGRHCVLVEPYGYRWFRVGRLDDVLKRADL
jgi:maltose alpha-D-glucosyltransferase/alpha-amylase